MTIDEAYVWYRGTPNALSELLEMKCEHEMIVKENKKLRVDWESERDYANQMEASVERLQAENARLRECLQEFADAIKNDDGFGVDQGWMLERMSEIGIRWQ